MGRFASLTLGVLVCLVFISGCRQGQQRTDIAMQEASRLQAPMETLSKYSKVKLNAMELKGEVAGDSKKVKAAKDLEDRLQTKLGPLLDSWNNGNTGDGSTLIIQPVLQNLYIVSAGSRFWVGGMAGNSSIDMDLLLTDEATGKRIAAPRIQRDASAMGGAYSVGGTDRNLPNYIVDIAYNYLQMHYKPSAK
ncbi:MAG: hypothetical protein V2B20_23340 [Pseudomonadota bacterium]